jgi:predicted nucleic acid-binding protein
MKPVFADTFFFLAVLNRADAAHARATELSRSLPRPRLTTDWVLTEVGHAMSIGGNRAAFVELVGFLEQSPLVTIVPASRALFQRGVELFSQRPDKEWTLTDCISFVVMGDAGIVEALTGDRHFEQAGFVTLMR